MATISKSRRKATPGVTKNGRVRLRSLNVEKLTGLLAKSQRPRDKDKIQRHINNLLAKSK